MRAISFLLRRYLVPRQGNLLAFSLWVAVAGVALGVMLLMVVLAVMSGFIQLFERNYTRISSDIVVLPRHRTLAEESFVATLSHVRGVEAVTPASFGQAMILKNGVGGAVLEGIDPVSSGKVTDWPEVWVKPPLADLQKKNSYWIWLGKQLADKLRVAPGDTVDVMVVDGQARRIVPFVVTAITKFGIYDHDLHYARVDIRALTEIFRKQDLEPFYKTRVRSGFTVAEVAANIKKEMGNFAIVKPWSDINQNVFLAVKHQKHLLFLILEIVVALAAMNVVNLLMMSSHHRRRDVAIWRAMGMRLGRVILFFVLQGAAVGFAGIVAGIGMGYGACALIENFQPSLLSEEVYNVSRLPLRVELGDIGLIAGAGFVLCVVFSLIPAIGAAVTRPVNALRYE